MNNKIIYIIAIILVIVAFIMSICIGKYSLSIQDIFEILMGTHQNIMSINVFYTLRLPRSIMVILAGIGLSMAGSIYQTIFKNPLASPDIIGVSSGANVGAAVSIVFFSGGVMAVSLGAFIGGMIAVLCVVGIVKLSRLDGVLTYVLSGIVINAISQGLIMSLKYFADPEKQLGAIEFWSMGSFGSVTIVKLITIVPFFTIGIIGLFLFRWRINMLSISDEEAKTMGISVEQSRYIILFFNTLVVASIVSVTGLISFIGLIPPHIARFILKKNDFKTTVFSGLIGAILLTFADCIARSIISSEIPISIITSFIGAPYLAMLVCMKNGSQNGELI